MLTAPGSQLTASMLRDLEAGAPIEADHIIGDLLRRAAKPDDRSLLRIATLHVRAYEAGQRTTGKPPNASPVDRLTAFGLFAVTAMVVAYAMEARSQWFTLAFAGACVLGSAYGFLQGASPWPGRSRLGSYCCE